MMFEILLSVLVSVITCSAFYFFTSYDQSRKVYSLECDLLDLREMMVNEIKKRAVKESWEKKKQDKKLDEMLATQQPTQAQAGLPWWQQFVHQDLKK